MEHLLSVSGATEITQEDPLGSYPHLAMPLWSPFQRSWKLGQKDSVEASAKLPRQDYEALQERCLRDGCLFEDDTFPATLSSIGSGHLLQKLPGRLQWRRPTVRAGEGAAEQTHNMCQPRPSFRGLRAFGYPVSLPLIPMKKELGKSAHTHFPGKNRSDLGRGLRCSSPSGQKRKSNCSQIQ